MESTSKHSTENPGNHSYAESQVSGRDILLRDLSDGPGRRVNRGRRPFRDRSSQDAPHVGVIPSPSGNSRFTEDLDVDPRRRLSCLDVAALIIDQMVGSGIFTTPGLVLSLTKSKLVSLGLWLVGGFHAFLW